MGHREFVSQVIHGAGGGEEGGERGTKQFRTTRVHSLFLLSAPASSGLAWRENPAALFSQTGRKSPSQSQQPAAPAGLAENSEAGHGRGRESTRPSCKVNTLGGPHSSPSGTHGLHRLRPGAWGNRAALAPGCDGPREVGEEEAVALGTPVLTVPQGGGPSRAHTGRTRRAGCHLPQPPAGPGSPDPCHAGFSSSGQRL